jgi:hypothetical protein
MAPAVAPATVLLAPGINIAFACYRNVTRIVSRRIHMLGNATTRIEIFVRCQNRACFHNSSFHAGAYGGHEEGAPHRLAFALQKLSRLANMPSLLLAGIFAIEQN